MANCVVCRAGPERDRPEQETENDGRPEVHADEDAADNRHETATHTRPHCSALNHADEEGLLPTQLHKVKAAFRV